MNTRTIAGTALGAVVVVGMLLVIVADRVNARTERERFRAYADRFDASVSGRPERGLLVARAGGCIACHTNTDNDGAMLAGGVVFETSFGRFVSPNITSDREAGIGSWTVDMLADALLNGRRPDGGHYWPAFPYTAYAALQAKDIVDLHAWLQSTDPVATSADAHELWMPDAARWGLGVWKALYVPDDRKPGRFTDRGEYLVKGPGHCAVCHAERNLIGGVPERALTGNSRGPDGGRVPPITQRALEGWTKVDIAFFLEIGMTPGGDFTGSTMGDVIEHGTGHLSPTDREAIADYLKSPANGDGS